MNNLIIKKKIKERRKQERRKNRKIDYDLTELLDLKDKILNSQNFGENLKKLQYYSKIVIPEKRRIKNHTNINFREYRQEKIYFAKTKCYVCKNNEAYCLHHILLLKNGGTNNLLNLIPICKSCHEKIHNWL